jgi:hypothetical protein
MVYLGPSWCFVIFDGVCAPSWSFMILSGCSWLFMVVHGCSWLFKVLYGNILVNHDSWGYFIVLHGPSWSLRSLMVFLCLSWSFVIHHDPS